MEWKAFLKGKIIRNSEFGIRNFPGGFTLIELIVVISLISIMLFFSIPRFQNTFLSDNTKKTSRWIIGKVRALKEVAVQDQKLYILHVNMDTNSLWVSNDSMSEKEIQNANQEEFILPDDVKVLDVEFPEKGKISSGLADIFFYKNNYSDKALIHIEDSDNQQLSFLIEPFLTKVKMYEKYAGFED